jgi:hypothetical protein
LGLCLGLALGLCLGLALGLCSGLALRLCNWSLFCLSGTPSVPGSCCEGRVDSASSSYEWSKINVAVFSKGIEKHLRASTIILNHRGGQDLDLVSILLIFLCIQDEEAAESTGARTFIVTHNKLNEVATKMLKDILNCKYSSNTIMLWNQ